MQWYAMHMESGQQGRAAKRGRMEVAYDRKKERKTNKPTNPQAKPQANQTASMQEPRARGLYTLMQTLMPITNTNSQQIKNSNRPLSSVLSASIYIVPVMLKLLWWWSVVMCTVCTVRECDVYSAGMMLWVGRLVGRSGAEV